MIYADRGARSLANYLLLLVDWKTKKVQELRATNVEQSSRIKRVSETDTIGLFLFGMAFALLHLPCSLASGADNDWFNYLMIAMIVS